MHPDWVREVRNDCAAAGVPFYFKQWGEWRPHNQSGMAPDTMLRVGRKRAGRVLDGRTHDALAWKKGAEA